MDYKPYPPSPSFACNFVAIYLCTRLMKWVPPSFPFHSSRLHFLEAHHPPGHDRYSSLLKSRFEGKCSSFIWSRIFEWAFKITFVILFVHRGARCRLNVRYISNLSFTNQFVQRLISKTIFRNSSLSAVIRIFGIITTISKEFSGFHQTSLKLNNPPVQFRRSRATSS